MEGSKRYRPASSAGSGRTAAAGLKDRDHGSERTIRYRTSLHNTVYDVFKSRKNWVETDSELDWDLFWADTGWVHENLDHVHLQDGQRINHFRNHYELTRKDLLVKNLKRTKKSLEREGRVVEAARYDFFPQTYALPMEYNLFVEEFKRTGGVWIMKPSGRAQGRGIFLLNKLSQIADWKKDARARELGLQQENYIVQRYIGNPYLIGGKKFDLRLYVIVLSYIPLRVYLYRSGFARFSNTRFSMKKEDISNTFIHLTNVAVQKTGENYDSKTGMKWALRDLKLFMLSMHPESHVYDLFTEIESLIVMSLLAVQNVIINDKHCFEVYGYDIMIDDTLKPWLVEVNASPSLTSDTPADHELKCAMVDDALNLVDVEQRNSSGVVDMSMGGFDLIWDGGPVAHMGRLPDAPSSLGCHNARLTEHHRGQPTH